MKTGTKILLGLGALWVWNGATNLYRKLNELRFGLAGIRFVTFNNEEKYIVLNIDFKIYNPYNIRLMFYSINCELLFNSQFVGKITSNINRYIYEKTETVIPISLRLNYADMGSSVWEHITSGGRIDDWQLTITGTTNIQNITLPLTLNFVFQDFVSGIGTLPNDWQNKYFAPLLSELSRRGYSYRISKVQEHFENLYPLIDIYLNRIGNKKTQRNVINAFIILYENNVHNEESLRKFLHIEDAGRE